MNNAPPDSGYVFLGFNAAGACPAMEMIACADAADATARARHWLASHRSCVRVQVWKDDVLVADLLGQRA